MSDAKEFRLPDNAMELTEIVVPEGVEKLNHFQFGTLKHLKKVLLPASLCSVQASVFPHKDPWSARDFERIDVAPGNPYFTSIDGTLYTKDMKTLVCVPANYPAEEFVVPDTVEIIAKQAFSGNGNILSVVLPKKLKQIEEHAFWNCAALRTINPIYTDSIGNGAFSDSGLEEVEIHAKTIGEYAFTSCLNLKTVSLYGVEVIGDGAFQMHKLDKLVLPETLKTIGKCAFSCCDWESVTIPKSVTSVGQTAFGAVKEIHVFDTLQTSPGIIALEINRINMKMPYHEIVVHNAESGEEKYRVVMDWDGTNKHQMVLSYGWCKGAKFDFQQHDAYFPSLKGADIKIQTAIRRLSDPVELSASSKEVYIAYVAKNAKAVMKKFIDDGDASGFSAFAEYGTITQKTAQDLIDYSIEKQQAEITAFLMDYQQKNLPVVEKKEKKTSLGTVKKAPKVETQVDGPIMTIGEFKKAWEYEEVKEPQPQFNPLTGQTSASLGDIPVEAIGGLMIKSYKDIYLQVVVPAVVGKRPVVAIADHAFSPKKYKLGGWQQNIRQEISQITLPNTLLYIGGAAFWCCNFEEIVIPPSVKKIGRSSFRDCVKLKKVTISAETQLGGAFAGCTALADENGMVIFHGTLDCCMPSKKKKIVIPSSVKKIASMALADCEKLAEIVIPESVEAIEGWLVNFQYSESVKAALTIIGKAGSCAEAYAKEQGIAFVVK